MNLVKLQDAKSTYKNQLCFYTLTMNQLKKKFLKIPIASKTIKYLGINLTKEVKDLYINNYNMLMKEIKTQIKDILYSCIETIDIIKMFIQPEATYRFNASPNKTPISFFTEIKKTEARSGEWEN